MTEQEIKAAWSENDVDLGLDLQVADGRAFFTFIPEAEELVFGPLSAPREQVTPEFMGQLADVMRVEHKAYTMAQTEGIDVPQARAKAEQR